MESIKLDMFGRQVYREKLYFEEELRKTGAGSNKSRKIWYVVWKRKAYFLLLYKGKAKRKSIFLLRD